MHLLSAVAGLSVCVALAACAPQAQNWKFATTHGYMGRDTGSLLAGGSTDDQPGTTGNPATDPSLTGHYHTYSPPGR